MSNGDKSHVGLGLCYFCGEPCEVILDRRLRDTLPHEAVYNMRPCPACEDWMKQGIILIGVRDGEDTRITQNNPMPNPYRTGGWWVVSEEAVRRVLQPQSLVDHLVKIRWGFIAQSAAEVLGLPPAEVAAMKSEVYPPFVTTVV